MLATIGMKLSGNCQLISDDFPGFAQLITKLFWFDFYFSAENFYDPNKQEQGKNRNQQTMP